MQHGPPPTGGTPLFLSDSWKLGAHTSVHEHENNVCTLQRVVERSKVNIRTHEFTRSNLVRVVSLCHIEMYEARHLCNRCSSGTTGKPVLFDLKNFLQQSGLTFLQLDTVFHKP